MEKEMRTLYIEGVAIHGGPESCVGVPVRAQRSVDRGRAGWAIEPRNPNEFRVPTSFSRAEGNTAGGVICESLVDPARSENPGTHDELHAREPGDLVVARQLVMMPRPGWFAGWQISAGRAVRGTLRR
jgi:hypothetical protein